MNNYLNFKIIGSGPSGLLLAISFAKLNFNIYITDLLTREKLINKDKTYAITHSTRKILSKFNLWSKLKPYLYKFDSLSISDSVTSDFTILNTSDLDKISFPMENKHSRIRVGSNIRCIISSNYRNFEREISLTDAWLPDENIWIGEYPYLLRPAFEEICYIYLKLSLIHI